jgi:hypothetical protein
MRTRLTYQERCLIPEGIAGICDLVAPAVEAGIGYCVAILWCDVGQGLDLFVERCAGNFVQYLILRLVAKHRCLS